MNPMDVGLALRCIYAEDAFTLFPGELTPTLDKRAGAAQVRGWIIGQDSVFGAESKNVCYGLLTEEAPGEFTAVIRGTGDGVEWFIDAEWLPMRAHSVAGKVETGFDDLYRTMQFVGLNNVTQDLVAGIAAVVGAGRLTVTGHSLGAALASLLAFDLGSSLKERLEAVLFASPRVGDMTFGTAFSTEVPAHRSYWWAADMVPKMPFGFSYAMLPGNIELTPTSGLTVCHSITCAHHALTYAAMLDQSVLKRFQSVGPDARFVKCVTAA